MKPTQVIAEPVADGRVSLSWITPTESTFRGVRILRRVRRFPDLADLDTDFEVFRDDVPIQGALRGYLDGPLQGETVYYYAVVAFDSLNNHFPEFVSAMTLVPYRSANHLYRNLPEIYQLFDQSGSRDTPGLATEDRGKGPLLRFLELAAQPFDMVRSLTSAMRMFHDVERVDGALLPLLGEWIGQPTDVTLNLERQRNEVRYAPHYYRTAGVPANLRAAVNRFTTWDARIKEFANNVFLATYPEQLTIQEIDRVGPDWQPARSVNLDIAYEGRVSPLRAADGRALLFYHSRREVAAGDEWQIYGKVEEQGQFLPSFRLTTGEDPSKHPSAVQRPDGVVWLFYARYKPDGSREVPNIALELLSAGRPALPARIAGALTEPFALADGDTFEITVENAGVAVNRHIAIRAEQLGSLASVSASALAAALDREIPGASVAAVDGAVVFTSAKTGIGAKLTIIASTLAPKIGVAAGVVTGADPVPAQLTSRAGPFTVADNDTLTLKVDADLPRTLVFPSASFANIATATAAEVAAAIEEQLPGVASVSGTAVRLSAPSVISVLVNESSAATKLGFGAPLPAPPLSVDEDEPSACVDGAGNVWLFWASRRDGSWKIWYDVFDGAVWGAPKVLTTQALPDREPFVVFDPAAGGRMWVFWSRRKANDLWNVFSRTTTNLNFATLADADWTERENGPVPPDFNNREPSATLAPTGEVELYFASDRADGWNTWTRTVTPTVQNAESAVTSGQATQRAPAAIRVSPTLVRLFVRTNDSVPYTSAVYPLAQTLDARYSGASTVDLRNPTKLSLRGNIRDLQRYTYDARRGDNGGASSGSLQLQPGLYARDCVGVYLTPDTDDQALILRQRRLFTNALRRFIPIQVRLAFLIDQVYPEAVYTYDLPDAPVQTLIGEQMVDTILPEVLSPAADSFSDLAPDVRFLRMFVPGETGVLPDLSVGPPNLNFRLFTTNFDEGA